MVDEGVGMGGDGSEIKVQRESIVLVPSKLNRLEWNIKRDSGELRHGSLGSLLHVSRGKWWEGDFGGKTIEVEITGWHWFECKIVIHGG